MSVVDDTTTRSAGRRSARRAYSWLVFTGLNQFGQMSMPQPPMGPRQASPLQHHGQLAQPGSLNPVGVISLNNLFGLLFTSKTKIVTFV